MTLGDWVSLTALLLGLFNMATSYLYQVERLKIERAKLRKEIEEEMDLKHRDP